MALYSTLFVVLSVIVTMVLAAGQEDVFEWQPEIHHQFRPDESMPATWFSQLFSLLVLSPWLILVLGWMVIGITPSKVMSGLSSQRGIWILAFVSSLAVTDYLFYLYWTQWNIFKTLTYVAGWSLVLFTTGQLALSSVQRYRLRV
ncbi:Oligosaccharyltransferase subunit Ribophorin II-domain-containing protein [Halteromyces radiatus]|uniref:Oligosaccharyltransferase subunit Ribophorin II-domain-containing protein n=1 Tax=Halteromyces radiatus TaxID=101107 RepID=UPI00221F3E94|nr:Oligosaccharyltransferase subunit Ribophorin II-domain-containing protein [Halteromyces radiatus]KAI8097276.1 Oligosaccharyltransferase subunit Ribophorin II-domain-containing protein [Halteromyces radiatus]